MLPEGRGVKTASELPENPSLHWHKAPPKCRSAFFLFMLVRLPSVQPSEQQQQSSSNISTAVHGEVLGEIQPHQQGPGCSQWIQSHEEASMCQRLAHTCSRALTPNWSSFHPEGSNAFMQPEFVCQLSIKFSKKRKHSFSRLCLLVHSSLKGGISSEKKRSIKKSTFGYWFRAFNFYSEELPNQLTWKYTVLPQQLLQTFPLEPDLTLTYDSREHKLTLILDF